MILASDPRPRGPKMASTAPITSNTIPMNHTAFPTRGARYWTSLKGMFAEPPARNRIRDARLALMRMGF